MTARFCYPAFCGAVLLHPCWGKTDGVHRTPLQKWIGAPLKGRSKSRVFEGKALSNRLLCALGLYQTLHDTEVVNQSNRKRCWSTALQNVLYRHLCICGIQFFTAELQSGFELSKI